MTKTKISFAPGCFDNFEGTQEELDEVINEITKVFQDMTPEDLSAKAIAMPDDWEPTTSSQRTLQ